VPQNDTGLKSGQRAKGCPVALPSTLKVILIDDDPQFTYLLQRYALNAKIQLIPVDSVAGAISAAQLAQPDAVFVNLTAGGTQPRRILQALRSDPAVCIVPIIVCYASEANEQEWDEQSDGFLQKPVMYEDFISALAEVVARPRPAANAQ
jgi:CheY-like chemotaxis protein